MSDSVQGIPITRVPPPGQDSDVPPSSGPVTQHNQLEGLQGGAGAVTLGRAAAASEYYHLTADAYAALAGMLHAPSASNPFATRADIPFVVRLISNGTTTIPPTPPTHCVYLADTSGGDVTVLLPVSTGWQGNIIHIKKNGLDENYVHVRSVSGALIDNTLDQTFNAPFMSLQFTAYADNWFIL